MRGAMTSITKDLAAFSPLFFRDGRHHTRRTPWPTQSQARGTRRQLAQIWSHGCTQPLTNRSNASGPANYPPSIAIPNESSQAALDLQAVVPHRCPSGVMLLSAAASRRREAAVICTAPHCSYASRVPPHVQPTGVKPSPSLT